MYGFNHYSFNKMPFNRGIFVRSLLFVGKTIRSVASKVWYSGLTRRILQRVSVFFGIRDKNFSKRIKGSH